MPKGKYVNHKGRSRHFTSPEELQRAEEDSDKNDNESENESGSNSGEDSESSEDENAKGKGVSKLIEIENPNRVKKKNFVKVDTAGSAELTRRDREEIEKQKARARYQKLHEQGKTAQARADLARLAIIRQQREDAAAKRGTSNAPKKSDEQPGTSKSDN